MEWAQLEKWFMDALNAAHSFVWGPFTIVLLVGTGLFLSIRVKFLQVRRFKHSFECISGKYDNPEEEGDVSHFQALCAALSATIGIGNIAGVAVAISWGGPGALFWMWITACVGMATKYASCSLAVKYRKVHPNGTVSGGPMYFIAQGLGWTWLAAIFAVFATVASFGIGCMTQANSVVDGVRNVLPPGVTSPTLATVMPFLREPAGATTSSDEVPEAADSQTTATGTSLEPGVARTTIAEQLGAVPIYKAGIGFLLAFLVGLVIIGGIRRIARVAQFLVPIMSVLYVGGALIILFQNASSVPGAFGQIFRYAFTPIAVGGGAIGFVVQQTIRHGVARGVFSNEAGLGSAPIAHAAAKTREMAREGFVAMIEPFVDTLLICTMTGLVILVSGAWMVRADDGRMLYGPGGTGRPAKHDGVLVVFEIDRESGKPILDGEGNPYPVPTSSSLTIEAFRSLLGHIGTWIVALGLVLFAYSTMLSWSYYGDRSIGYLLGQGAVMPYRWVFCVFVFVGSVGGLQTIWTVADTLNACMAFPNLIALILLSGVVARETKDYLRRMDEEKQMSKHQR